ncbi:MAG TPA: SHOCT domain-containing protein [Candidatus Acidoferrum sp.]|nr:SHOCT domain-containing protein [Candidatus Acidoferrum sp.]
MKKCLVPAMLALSVMLFCGGCIGGLNMGGGSKTEVRNPTLGQQLIDLQKARDSGAISPAEYDAKKAELLTKK